MAQVIARDKPLAAKLWIEAMFKAVERLKAFPLSGRFVPEVKKHSVREVISGNNRIIYRIEKERVFVLTIRHVRQILHRSNLNES